MLTVWKSRLRPSGGISVFSNGMLANTAAGGWRKDLSLLPVNASTADFGKGKTLIYNLSSTTLQARMGSRIVVLEPGKSKTLDAPRPDFGPYPVAIDCVPAGETVPRAISRSTWQNDPGARQILFVTLQDGIKIPRVRGLLVHSEDKPEKDG